MPWHADADMTIVFLFMDCMFAHQTLRVKAFFRFVSSLTLTIECYIWGFRAENPSYDQQIIALNAKLTQALNRITVVFLYTCTFSLCFY